MKIKTLATGSTGNCYILTSDSGKHLILDAGVIIPEIKKGIDYDVGNIEGCIVTHCHMDHAKSAMWIKAMGIPVWRPYEDTEHKRLKTKMGCFEISCFDVPHNGCENRAFIIKVDGVTILYATDFEYIPYDLTKQGINIALVEMNYQSDRINSLDQHRQHTVLGHAEEQTVIELVSTIVNRLRKVVLCHMSMSGALDRALAIEHMREVIPAYIGIQYAKAGEEIDISEVPF